MHITELRLTGFKSFVDPARAPIEQGLTGIVGPNGCGKSNLLEAVRWVMGATSAKAMRASDMDDVIFSGTAGRPAREHAEVTLLLADALGRAPAPFHKEDVLEITRRIRRGLGSTYRINNKEVRAKDVQLLFADAATGANSPALVRQGQVSELIAAKPENRRRILEDAAGIAGLHARRHEADLKLRAADANLTRLDEVLAEIDAQAQSLEKQARQAERYRGLAQTLRETEALLLHRRWSEARTRQAEANTLQREAERINAQTASDASAAQRAANDGQEALGPLREEEMVAAAILRRLEGVRVGLERDLAEAQALIDRCASEARRAAEETERLTALKQDSEIALVRLAAESTSLGPADDAAARQALKAAEAARDLAAARRDEAEVKVEALAADAAASRARALALQDAAQAARARLHRLEQRGSELTAQLHALPEVTSLEANLAGAKATATALSAELWQLSEGLAQTEALLQRAQASEEAAWGPYRAAESAARELEAEVGALGKLAPPADTKFPPVLASLEVEPGFERALAAALGDDLEASTLTQAPAHWAGAAAPASLLPRAAQALAGFVKAPGALAARLALVGVVEAKLGPALLKHLATGVRLVSREGDLWRWDGFVRRAEAPQPAAARLEHKNRLRAADSELKASKQVHARAKAAWDQAKAARMALETKTRELRAQTPRRAAAESEAMRVVGRLEAECARLGERRTELAAQLQHLEPERTEARAVASAAAAASGAGAGSGDEAELAHARAQVGLARQAAAEASATAQGLTRERAHIEGRRQAIDAEGAQWRAHSLSADGRLAILEAELNDIEKRRDGAKAAPALARTKLEALMEEAGEVEARRAQAGDRVAEAQAHARAASDGARAAEQAHAAAREQRASAEAHAAAADQRLADIATLAREQTGAMPEELASRAGNLITGALATAPISELERRMERLKAERDAGGLVNLRAHEELTEAQGRIATLTKEKDDVAQAITKLRRAITTLNNEGRARLLAAFEQVNAHFAQLFTALFEGGQAALKLTENEDPLDAGLEIFAQPPGKRLTHLSLLSGGEQALTATALIFAVFLSNPAPLCVLDEVDAPLDDANVDRFCRLLDEMKKLTTTRFIVITHNPVTMSRMDRLYGVTMPEQGLSQLVSVDLGRAVTLAAE